MKCIECGGKRWSCTARAIIRFPVHDEGEDWNEVTVEEVYHSEDEFRCWNCDGEMYDETNKEEWLDAVADYYGEESKEYKDAVKEFEEKEK